MVNFTSINQHFPKEGTKVKKKYICMFFSFIVSFTATMCFFSCSKTQRSSFTTELDTVDSYISMQSNKDAIAVLKKLDKRASTPLEKLGVYKRYEKLGERKLAEKLLVKAIKKFHDNPELCAVYTNFLLKEKRIEEAFLVSKKIQDTKYESFYAECVLKKALLAIKNGSDDILRDSFNPSKKIKKDESISYSQEQIAEVFSNQQFVPIYENAFKSGEDNKWIYNAVSVLMKNGEYKAACNRYPGKISSFSDSLFWGCVFYDSNMFAQSLETLLASEKLANLNGQNVADDEIKAEILILTADAYYVIGEEEQSEQMRKNLLLLKKNKDVPSSVFMNSALFAKRNRNFIKQHSYIKKLLKVYPDYEPGLAAYSEYALENLRLPEESDIVKKIREKGLKTRQMEQNDSVPKISIDDAISQIEESYERTKNPALIVLKESVLQEQNRILGEETNITRIYLILEKNLNELNSYPSELINYAVIYLLECNDDENAERLFNAYMKNKYSFSFTEHCADLQLWECELLAWFSCKHGRFDEGETYYDYIVRHTGNKNELLNSTEANASILNAFVNLSAIYESTDRNSEALKTLNTVSARTIDEKLKAEVLYRIAKLHWNLGEEMAASRSVQYALTFNPEHKKARLLQKKIHKKL